MIHQYNDNELLYLMWEKDDHALQLLFVKYQNLIHKRLHAFRIKSRNYDDFFQEGMMALNDAINSYNTFHNKTFNKYFDLILQRRIIHVLRKERDYFYSVQLSEDMSWVLEEEKTSYFSQDYGFNLIEAIVFDLKIRKNYRISEIKEILNCDVKKVYNVLFKIKQKILDCESSSEK